MLKRIIVWICEALAIPVLVGIVALSLAFVAGGCSFGNSKPNASKQSPEVQNVGSDYQVVRVPVDGSYVTCVVAANKDTYGATRRALSCDWIGYHRDWLKP